MPVSYLSTKWAVRFVFEMWTCAVQPKMRRCDTSGGQPVLASWGLMWLLLPLVGRMLMMCTACATAMGQKDRGRDDADKRRVVVVMMV